MKHLIVFLLALSISSFTQAFASKGGRTVGNGGDVLKCIDADKNESYQILDWYEGSQLRGLFLNLGSENLPLIDKLNIALKRLSRLSPLRAKQYEDHLKSFLQDTRWLTNGDLIDIPDSDHISIPEGCKIEHIANQSTPILSSDKRYIINQKLWNKLDTTQQATLMLHEVIYREALSLGHNNSVSSRFLNSIILSNEVEQISVVEFNDILFKLDFSTNLVQGAQIDLRQYEFYNNGKLKSAQVIPDSPFKLGENTIAINGTISFYEDGSIKELTPSQNGQLVFNKSRYNVLPFPISFYSNGNLESIMIEASDYRDHINNLLSIKGVVKFYSNGQLKIAIIERGVLTFKQLGNQRLNVEGVIRYYENGNVEEVTPTNSYAIPFLSDTPNWGGEMTFDPRGNISSAYLRDGLVVNLQNKTVTIKSYSSVEFWSEIAKIKKASINFMVTLLGQNRNKINIPGRSEILLDESGLVIEWN